MKFFLDTEFTERGPLHPIKLISIGIVDERGGEFYAVSSEFDEADCNEWVRENVLPHLGDLPRRPLSDIAILVREWVDVQCEGSKPEFWGYYADYDWVVTAQMFGTMMDLPKGWPMYCRDLKQWCDALGNHKLPIQSTTEHNALNDARWNKRAYEFLTHAQSVLDLPDGPSTKMAQESNSQAIDSM